MRKRVLFLFLAALIALGGVLGACAQEPAPPPAAELPEVLILGSLGIGTGTYIIMSGVREVVEQYSPMKVRVEPYQGDTDAILGLKEGLWTTICFSTNAVMPAHLGWGYWGAPEQGPVKLRSILRGNDYFISFVTTRDSGIKSIADLKGKKIPIAPKKRNWDSLTSIEEAYLAFAGLTLDDIVPIPVTGVTGALTALKEGRVDAAHGVHVSAIFGELQASPKGIWWLPMPHSDAAGWERMQSVAPMIYPAEITMGFIDDEQKPLEVGSIFTGLWTLDTTDEELVYTIVKALDEGYGMLKEAHPSLGQWSVDDHAFKNIGTIPYHPGSIRYFKEKGIWGPTEQAQHDAQLEAEKKVIAEWQPIPE